MDAEPQESLWNDLQSEEKERLLCSMDDVRISDTMTCLGLFAAPLFAKYPFVDLWDYEILGVVRAAGSMVHVPPPIQSCIGPDPPEAAFFTVQRCPSESVSFLPHLWCFPGVQPGERLGYEDNQEVGLFAFAGSNATPVDVHWNMVGWHQVHIHPQKGGMCLSPNNGRIQVSLDALACVWSVIRLPDRVCVGLHWLVPPAVSLPQFHTVQELLQLQGPHVDALAFLISGQADLGPLETGPIPSRRKKKNQQKKNKKKNKKKKPKSKAQPTPL